MKNPKISERVVKCTISKLGYLLPPNFDFTNLFIDEIFEIRQSPNDKDF